MVGLNWENSENVEFEDFDKKVLKIFSKLWKCDATDSSLLIMTVMRMMMKIKEIFTFSFCGN